MPKILEFEEDTSIGGAEAMYVVDGSTDKFARVSTMKSVFSSSVITLATLKAYKGLSDNQVVNLIGGTVDNDEVAGQFYWDSSSTATADDQDVVKVTDVVTGRWLRLLDQKYVNKETDTTTGVLVPTGTVQMYAGASAPTGYLLCNGAEVSRTTYDTLFGVIGVTFGSASGETFTLPDFLGRSPVGVGTGDASGATLWTLGEKGGTETETLDETQIPAHEHLYTGIVAGDGELPGARTYPMMDADDTASVTNKQFGSLTGGGLAHNNMSPVLGINYIIKT